MQPTLDPSEMKGIADIWNTIVNPPENPPEETETADKSDSDTPQYDAGTGHMSVRDELEASGKFSADEIDSIMKNAE